MESDNRGFTIKEFFIIAVVLCVIASIAVPRFSMARSQAKATELLSRIHMIRAQIELYQVQHNQMLPSVEDFETIMTTVTDIDGAVWVDSVTSGHPYGPYMRKVPNNPFSKGKTVNGTGDWRYTPDFAAGTYTFIADDKGVLPDGRAHGSL